MESFTVPLKAILLKAGCRFERQGKGDHEIWFSPITANAVLKQAGLPKQF